MVNKFIQNGGSTTSPSTDEETGGVKITHIRGGEFADKASLDRFIKSACVNERVGETVKAIRQLHPDAKFRKDGAWK